MLAKESTDGLNDTQIKLGPRNLSSQGYSVKGGREEADGWAPLCEAH